MPDLPIRRIVMYKHGVGYFERRGEVEGTTLRLSFPREAMDDVLKSLVALDLGAGQVRGVDFETPEDRAARLAKGSIHLSDGRSLLDLLRDLRGRRVRLAVAQPAEAQAANADEPEAARAAESVEGTIIGVDIDDERPLRGPLVSLYLAGERTVRSLPVHTISRLEILDDQAAADLDYFLRASQSEEERRAATLHLSEGAHNLLVGYVAPAPAWRVSYRILAEPDASVEQPAPEGANPAAGLQSSILLQGWGLFDNQLDEDLEGVTLTLVAGMPVSFRYRLYEPRTPERPLVEDEERTVAAPVEFAAMAAGAMPPPPAPMMAPAPAGAMKRARAITLAADEAMPEAEAFSIDAMAQTTSAASSGEERGALFQYRVAHPVSVARGQSAMVPIVVHRLGGRKELLYNGRKLAKHPVASLRMRNSTGLTLERGPATVIEEGDYAGEAVLPFTRPQGELIVPYAVELGISVVEDVSSERVMAGLRVREGYLLIQEWDVQTIVYRLHSTLQQPVAVIVEQREPSGYEVFESQEPAERAQGLARWAVTCAPAAETTFRVKHRRMVSRREQVRSFNLNQLQEFLRHRFLDEPTYKALAQVLQIYATIAQHQGRLRQIEQERQQIYKRQQQTQGSLGPLARDGEEGKLRSRYVQQLNDLENQLNRLAHEESGLQAEIARLEQEAASQIARLSSE